MTIEDPLELYDLLWLQDISPDSTEQGWSVSSLRDRINESIDWLDYLLEIDRWSKALKLLWRDGELIWTIWVGTFERGKLYHERHLYKKVESEFKGKWFWTALMQEYIDAGFPLPNIELTWVYKTYILLSKFWYIFDKILNPKNWKEIYTEEIPSNEHVKVLIKKWYVIQMRKNDNDE